MDKNPNRVRIAIVALSVSAAAFVNIISSEGYTEKATVPTENDRPTVGFGSTFRDDGKPVQMGDTITPPKAVARSHAHIVNDEVGIKRCIRAPLYQAEYDTLVDFAYQYGAGKTCISQMVREVNLGNYAKACEGYLLYKHSGGFDCSIPGNKRCSGVWVRNKKRYTACMQAQA